MPRFRELLIGKPRRAAQGDKLQVLYVLAHGKGGELRQRPARSNTDLWHVWDTPALMRQLAAPSQETPQREGASV